MNDHYAPTCPRCHAAQLIVDALDIINPDDCYVRFADVIDCGKVCFAVLSDDVGEYTATFTVEVEP